MNKTALLILSVIIVLTYLIRVPAVDPAADPQLAYLYGLLEMLTGIVGLLAWIGLLWLLIPFLYRKSNKFSYCSACGTKAESSDDHFCRQCGAALGKQKTGIKKPEAD